MHSPYRTADGPVNAVTALSPDAREVYRALCAVDEGLSLSEIRYGALGGRRMLPAQVRGLIGEVVLLGLAQQVETHDPSGTYHRYVAKTAPVWSA